MKMKGLLRLPEALLPVSILLGPLIIGKRTIDIQIHDTYFVFVGSRWGNVFFAPFFSVILVTWIFHVVLRRKSLLSDRWRRIQVNVTIACWLAMLLGLIIPRETRFRMGVYLMFHAGRIWPALDFILFTAPSVVFILNQLIFWIVATIRIISARRRRVSERTS